MSLLEERSLTVVDRVIFLIYGVTILLTELIALVWWFLDHEAVPAAVWIGALIALGSAVVITMVIRNARAHRQLWYHVVFFCITAFFLLLAGGGILPRVSNIMGYFHPLIVLNVVSFTILGQRDGAVWFLVSSFGSAGLIAAEVLVGIGIDTSLYAMLGIISTAIAAGIFGYIGARFYEHFQVQRAQEQDTLDLLHAYLAAIFNQISEGLIVVDTAGTIMQENDTVETLLGSYPRVGRQLRDVLPLYRSSAGALMNEHPMDGVLEGKTKERFTLATDTLFLEQKEQHSFFPVTAIFSPLFIDDQPVGGLMLFRDISNEYAIDRERTQFMSLSAHHLRTPLSVINWSSECLTDLFGNHLSDTQKDYLAEIRSAANDMRNLINNILHIRRIRSGFSPESIEHLDIIAVTESVLKRHAQGIEKKQHTVAFTHAAASLPFDGDRYLLDMVIDNLISNAIKYTPEGGNIRITADTHAVDGFVFSVSDSGVGIPADEHERVFQKLFRASNVIQGKESGTGLGLYMVHQIITESGGDITFDSEPGRGTTFTITYSIGRMKTHP